MPNFLPRTVQQGDLLSLNSRQTVAMARSAEGEGFEGYRPQLDSLRTIAISWLVIERPVLSLKRYFGSAKSKVDLVLAPVGT